MQAQLVSRKVRQVASLARQLRVVSDASLDVSSSQQPDAVSRGGSAPGGRCHRRSFQSSGAREEGLPAHTVLNFPSLSPTMSSGTLVSWNVKIGQLVAPGDVLAEVETDKATLAWENQDDGYVAKLLVEDGAGVEVGRGVCVLCDEEEDVGKFEGFRLAGSVEGSPAPAAGNGVATGSSQPSQPIPSDGLQRVGPAARNLMAAHGLQHAPLGTGPRGVVTKEDVLFAVEHRGNDADGGDTPPAVAAAAAAVADTRATRDAGDAMGEDEDEGPEYVDIPTTNMRKVIARRLLESKTTVPHMYASVDILLDDVLRMRKTLAAAGTKVSVNDCVLRAVALALSEVPAANAFWDDSSQSIKPSPAVDVCVAVATEGGLFTPIVKDANNKSLSQISADVRRLATKAKENKLLPEEYVGGSFSVSNLGMFGVEKFSAIVNPPQGGILAVGGGRQVVRVRVGDGDGGGGGDGDGDGSGGGLETVTEMTVTLSADGRVYDGETAGAFLAAVKRNMEDPIRLSIM